MRRHLHRISRRVSNLLYDAGGFLRSIRTRQADMDLLGEQLIEAVDRLRAAQLKVDLMVGQLQAAHRRIDMLKNGRDEMQDMMRQLEHALAVYRQNETARTARVS